MPSPGATNAAPSSRRVSKAAGHIGLSILDRSTTATSTATDQASVVGLTSPSVTGHRRPRPSSGAMKLEVIAAAALPASDDGTDVTAVASGAAVAAALVDSAPAAVVEEEPQVAATAVPSSPASAAVTRTEVLSPDASATAQDTALPAPTKHSPTVEVPATTPLPDLLRLSTISEASADDTPRSAAPALAPAPAPIPAVEPALLESASDPSSKELPVQ